MRNKFLSALICTMVLSASAAPVVFASETIIDTNGVVVTSEAGSVVDTGESSEGYTGLYKDSPSKARGSSDYYYYSDPDPISTADGGKLYSHTERQRYGELAGTVRTFRYYFYSKYSGNSTVEKVSSEWYTTAKLRSQATLSLNCTLGLGKTSSIEAGTSSTWQNVTSPTKTWTNSNGTKTVYEQSNFAVSPDSDLSGFEVSIVQTSKVKLKGDNKTYSLTSGC